MRVLDLLPVLLESWDKQAQIIANLTGLINEENRHFLPSPDGWPLDEQLRHINMVRSEWLKEVAPAEQEGLQMLYVKRDGKWIALEDLELIKSELKKSAAAVRRATESAILSGEPKQSAYAHPLLYMQHMIWHEGWHAGLIMLALRVNGQETTEQWEEANIWGLWRTENWE